MTIRQRLPAAFPFDTLTTAVGRSKYQTISHLRYLST